MSVSWRKREIQRGSSYEAERKKQTATPKNNVEKQRCLLAERWHAEDTQCRKRKTKEWRRGLPRTGGHRCSLQHIRLVSHGTAHVKGTYRFRMDVS